MFHPEMIINVNTKITFYTSLSKKNLFNTLFVSVTP